MTKEELKEINKHIKTWNKVCNNLKDYLNKCMLDLKDLGVEILKPYHFEKKQAGRKYKFKHRHIKRTYPVKKFVIDL